MVAPRAARNRGRRDLTLLAKGLAGEVASGIGGLPKLPISPVMVAVVLGMLWRNTLGVPRIATDGLQWVMRGLLRTGIALVGLRLTLSGATAIAANALPVALACISVGLVGATFVGRLFGVPPGLRCCSPSARPFAARPR